MLLLRWRNPPFQRRAMIGGEALQIANGDGQVKFSTSTGILTGCGAHASANGRERVRLRGHVERLVVTSLGDQADIQTGVGANGAGCLARCPQVFFALTQPGAPALPCLLPFGHVPGMLLAPWRLTRLFRRSPRVGIQWLPAPFRRQVRDRTALRVDQFLDAALNGDGIGRALLHAHMAPHTLRHLYRHQHHPRTLSKITRDRALHIMLASHFALPRWTGHVETAYRT